MFAKLRRSTTRLAHMKPGPRFKPKVAILCSIPLTARADTLFNFDFTGISGPGSTLSFAVRGPPLEPDYGKPVDVTYDSIPITVDGQAGYTGSILLWGPVLVTPEIEMVITPDIPDPPQNPPLGQPVGQTDVSLYDLSSSVISLVSQTTAPSGSYRIDTLQIDPGTYSLILQTRVPLPST